MPLQAFEPLVPGTIAPRIEAAGWLNGEPQNEVAGDESGRVLTVLDIWANWCPVCQTAPPAPVKLYEKYHGRNVRFISLTDVSREAAEQLIARFSIAWPSGYGSPDGTINAYGALRLEARPGREINPIVYLIGPDGRILWSDGNARPKHENFGAACGKLDQEIEAALRMLANEAVSK
jgi:thiol-disulfide isomerase/thioredoxin